MRQPPDYREKITKLKDGVLVIGYWLSVIGYRLLVIGYQFWVNLQTNGGEALGIDNQ